jgi:hypothetical protein
MVIALPTATGASRETNRFAVKFVGPKGEASDHDRPPAEVLRLEGPWGARAWKRVPDGRCQQPYEALLQVIGSESSGTPYSVGPGES